MIDQPVHSNTFNPYRCDSIRKNKSVKRLVRNLNEIDNNADYEEFILANYIKLSLLYLS